MPDTPPEGSSQGWRRLLAPFRSEAAAFNVVLITVATCLVIALVAVLVRALV